MEIQNESAEQTVENSRAKIEVPLYNIEQELVSEMNVVTQKYDQERTFAEQANFNFNKSVEELFVNIRTNFMATPARESEEYKQFLHQTCKEFYQKLTGFYEAKAREKMGELKVQYNTIEELYANRYRLLNQEIDNLQSQFKTLKEREEAATWLIEHIAAMTRRAVLMNGCWSYWHREWLLNKKAEINAAKAYAHYQRYLLKRVLRFWKGWSYKNALNKKWKLKHSIHISEIKEQYMAIINELKLRIEKIEVLINTRRKARMELSFSLSKNLMKSISNLSMEVMNLNQTTFKGDIYSYEKTKQQLQQTTEFISQKLSEISLLKSRVEIVEEEEQ